MLPDAQDAPSRACEGLIHQPVSLDVPAQLLRPEGRVCPGLGSVLGAGMPEATVDEHGDVRFGEGDIHAYLAMLEVDAEVLPEAESEGMKL